jgi:rhodanese-related sulfurtransferase
MVATVTAAEAAELIATSNVDVIDVRDVDAYVAGHIPAARVVPLEVLRTDTDRELAGKPALLFVCQRGVRSLNAAKLAERLGYEKIYNLEGGTDAWARAGLPIAADQHAAAA